MRTIVVVTLLLTWSIVVGAQQLSSQTRAQEIAASFNKHKNSVKEKYGVRFEKYKDVRSEPLVKQNLSDYSGVYEVVDLDFVINIQVDGVGRIQANGYDSDAGGSQPTQSFRLEQAKITGALLTGNKVYDNGAAEKFEGVFMTRTERTNPSDNGVTLFGLGVLLGVPREHNSLTYDKLFYQCK